MRAVAASEMTICSARFPGAFGATLPVKLFRYLLIDACYRIYSLSRQEARFLLGDIRRMAGPSSAIRSRRCGRRAFMTINRRSDIPIGIVETVAMAFLGSSLPCLIAVPLGFIGARTVVGNPLAHFLVRRVFDFFRGIPPLIWALVFTRAVGLGPMTGVLAFIAADFAALAKLNAEAIENRRCQADRWRKIHGPADLRCSRLRPVAAGVPVMLGQALYFFESNVRAAAILGIVGAGGIGRILDQSMRLLYWREVGMIILLFLVAVALIDTARAGCVERMIGRATVSLRRDGGCGRFQRRHLHRCRYFHRKRHSGYSGPGGLWTQMKPITFEEYPGSEDARKESWRRRFEGEDFLAAAKPNDGHYAVAALVGCGKARRSLPRISTICIMPRACRRS